MKRVFNTYDDLNNVVEENVSGNTGMTELTTGAFELE